MRLFPKQQLIFCTLFKRKAKNEMTFMCVVDVLIILKNMTFLRKSRCKFFVGFLEYLLFGQYTKVRAILDRFQDANICDELYSKV